MFSIFMLFMEFAIQADSYQSHLKVNHREQMRFIRLAICSATE